MNIGPTPRSILADMASTMTWKDIVSELIDNSLDAGAFTVEVVFKSTNGHRTFTVIDNGTGCRDVSVMLTSGKRIHQRTTRLGRHAVGLKDAIKSLEGVTVITTIHNKKKARAVVDWKKVAEADSWEVEDPQVLPAIDGEVGTTIRCRNIAKAMPKYADLAAEIGYTFSPALRHGKQIVIKAQKKNIVVLPHDMPPLENIIEDEFEVNGKGVKLRVGIVKESHVNRHAGFTFIHEHRVIRCSSLGANGYSVSRVAGTVELDKRWKLSRHKNDIVSGQEDLGNEIYKRCKGILESAQTQTMTIVSDQFMSELTKMMRSALTMNPKRKAKRKSPTGEKPGTVDPVETGRKHKRAKKTQPGESLMDKIDIGKLTIDWQHFDGDTFGSIDFPGNRILLNESNSFLIGLQAENNKKALLPICFGLFSHGVCDEDQYDKFPSMRQYNGFVESWAALTMRLQESGVFDTEVKQV